MADRIDPAEAVSEALRPGSAPFNAATGWTTRHEAEEVVTALMAFGDGAPVVLVPGEDGAVLKRARVDRVVMEGGRHFPLYTFHDPSHESQAVER